MSFTFNLKKSTKYDFTNILEISGELRRGTSIESGQLQAAISNAKQDIADTYLIFDLSNLTFWDTEGMLLIIQAIYEINKKKNKRSGFVEPTISHLVTLADPISFAKRKLKDPAIGLEQIPYKKNIDDLVLFLQG